MPWFGFGQGSGNSAETHSNRHSIQWRDYNVFWYSRSGIWLRFRWYCAANVIYVSMLVLGRRCELAAQQALRPIQAEFGGSLEASRVSWSPSAELEHTPAAAQPEKVFGSAYREGLLVYSLPSMLTRGENGTRPG